jgi:3-oxoacyl-[acyl-carrier protein] reductase/bacilysin biosynthesis oxidoreductase BacG
VNLELEGKRVLVTGASRGIGASIVRAFADEGAAVALVTRQERPLRAVADTLSQRGAKATPIVGDLGQAGSAADIVTRSLEALEGIDILINNAGASPFGSFDAIGDEQWRDAFELKLMGYVRCIRAVLPHMRLQRRGTIINVVGTAGRHAAAGYALGAINAALLHLTRSLAEVVIAGGIRVSAINPGYTNTERIREAMPTWAQDAGQDVESFTREFTGGLPLGRFAEPDEVARLVVLLASDVMTLTLGSALQADGGSARGHF